MLKKFRRAVALVVLMASVLMVGSTALAAPLSPKAPQPPALQPKDPEAPPPGKGPEDCNGEQACISSWQTYLIKKAIREALDALQNNLPRVLRLLSDYIPEYWMRSVRTRIPYIIMSLNRLLEFQDLVYQTIYDQTKALLIREGAGPLVSHWVALAARWIVEWGLF